MTGSGETRKRKERGDVEGDSEVKLGNKDVFQVHASQNSPMGR